MQTVDSVFELRLFTRENKSVLDLGTRNPECTVTKMVRKCKRIIIVA